MQNSSINNRWDEYYSQGKDFGLITAEMLDKVLAHTNTPDSKNALDIGCGTGQLTRELYHRGYLCVGIDLSPVAIEKAKKYTIYADELQYLTFDIEKDDIAVLPSQPYTLIVCKLVYAFIQDKEKFLKQVKQLLATGGAFVIITPLHADVPDKPAIAVEYEKTIKDLKEHFETVESFKGLGVTYFICESR